MYSRILAVLLTATYLCAQPKPGTVDGTSLNSITNTSVQKAVVTLLNVQQDFSYVAVSDAAGHFHFSEVEPGTYQVVTVSAQGYSFLRPTREKAVSATILVGADQHVTGISVRLLPLGVITGKVVDQEGEPLPGANIHVFHNDYSRGSKALKQVGEASTNDRGEYRIFDLQPGRYYLRASVTSPEIRPNMKSDRPESGYTMTFYPGESDVLQASHAEVQPGAETPGVDFRLQKVPVYHVRGKIENIAGNNGAVHSYSCEGTPFLYWTQTGAPVQGDGEFDLGGLTPGVYCLIYGDDKGLYVRARVSIADRSVSGMRLSAVPAVDLQGVVQTEGIVPLPAASQQPMRVLIQPFNAVGSYQSANVRADGTFVLPGLAPEQYLINFYRLPKGTYVQSLELGEREVSDGPLDLSVVNGPLRIRLASDGGQLNATVLTEKGEPAPNVSVNILPQGGLAHARDSRRVAVSDQNGKVQQAGLAPGDYRIVAFYDDNPNLALADDFVAELGGKPVLVTIHSGATESVDVKVISSEELERIKSKL